jgi:hypothetical protein
LGVPNTALDSDREHSALQQSAHDVYIFSDEGDVPAQLALV